MINNGVASKHFFLERGVRQGCPLSGILFVIAMELLAQSIKRSKDIKGIHIQGNEEVKLTQYADDTTALLADVQSVSNLFYLLSRFEKCSGLQINQAKSEMLWLGSMRHRKDAICNLQISDDPVYAFYKRLHPLTGITQFIFNCPSPFYGEHPFVLSVSYLLLSYDVQMLSVIALHSFLLCT